MANEITISGSMSFDKSGVTPEAVGDSWTNEKFDVTGSAYIKASMSVTTSATAIPLGGVTTPHWAQFQNLDPTNYVQIQNGSGGSPFLRLNPGEMSPAVPLDSSCVPYVIAHTAACIINYLIVQA